VEPLRRDGIRGCGIEESEILSLCRSIFSELSLWWRCHWHLIPHVCTLAYMCMCVHPIRALTCISVNVTRLLAAHWLWLQRGQQQTTARFFVFPRHSHVGLVPSNRGTGCLQDKYKLTRRRVVVKVNVLMARTRPWFTFRKCYPLGFDARFYYHTSLRMQC